MIQKEIAKILDGVKINEEDTNKQDMRYAKENGCVIVFGARNECADEDCPYFAKMSKAAKCYVTALWLEEKEYSWTYKTNIPNTKTFNVMENEKRYCRGVVFDLNDVEEVK